MAFEASHLEILSQNVMSRETLKELAKGVTMHATRGIFQWIGILSIIQLSLGYWIVLFYSLTAICRAKQHEKCPSAFAILRYLIIIILGCLHRNRFQ